MGERGISLWVAESREGARCILLWLQLFLLELTKYIRQQVKTAEKCHRNIPILLVPLHTPVIVAGYNSYRIPEECTSSKKSAEQLLIWPFADTHQQENLRSAVVEATATYLWWYSRPLVWGVGGGWRAEAGCLGVDTKDREEVLRGRGIGGVDTLGASKPSLEVVANFTCSTIFLLAAGAFSTDVSDSLHHPLHPSMKFLPSSYKCHTSSILSQNQSSLTQYFPSKGGLFLKGMQINCYSTHALVNNRCAVKIM